MCRIYYQTHFSDGAYPEADTGKNSNYPWAFVDDMTELYFSSPDHMRNVFTSDHVKEVVGPDGEAFSDFGAANAMLSGGDQVIWGDGGSVIDAALVANYYIEAKGTPEDGAEFLASVQPILLECIEKFGAGQVFKVVVTTRSPDPAHILKYFGGDTPSPNYSAVFTMYLKSVHSTPSVRKIQSAFEEAARAQLKRGSEVITFGKRALMFDQTRGLKFEKSRQPVFEEL